jgi:hypothetical protein
MSQTTPPTESATGRWYLLGFLLLFGGATLYFSLNQPKENAPPPKKSDEIVDPRVSYSGPFRNLHPDVKEVGGTICATCHLEICQSFRQHPMGQSMLPISKVLNSLALDANGKTTFTIAGVDYSTRRDGDRWFHLESRKDAAGNLLYEREMEVQVFARADISSRPGLAGTLSNRNGIFLPDSIARSGRFRLAR